MGAPVVHMRILQAGERTEGLLARLAERLGRDRLTPTAEGLLPITFVGDDVSQAEAWTLVHDALHEANPDWEELVTIGAPPPNG